MAELIKVLPDTVGLTGNVDGVNGPLPELQETMLTVFEHETEKLGMLCSTRKDRNT